MQYEDVSFETQEYEQIMLHRPEAILEDEDLFRYGLEHLFYIENKDEQIQRLILKEAQRRFLRTYFELKAVAKEGEIGALIIILKSRQQGMTTLIAAICSFEMMLRPNRSSLIIAHEKSSASEIIFKIYERFLNYFPFAEWDTFKQRYGDGYEFHNGSDIDVEYEKPQGVVGRTTQFLHLSEAGRFRYLDTFLGSFMPGMPKRPHATGILESTAEKSGDAFHTMWQQAERGNSRWMPVFYPWYIDEDNYLKFDDQESKNAFAEGLQIREDSIYGDEAGLLEKYDEITLEHLHARRRLIDELPHGLASFKREFPTTPEEAFMGVNQPVFDIQILRKYEKEQMKTPAYYGEMSIDYDDMKEQPARFVETPHGIIKIWKLPGELPIGTTVICGSDHSEGANDWNTALFAALYPYEIIAEIVGYEGFNPIPRMFARQMYFLGKWYNDAWICPESNPPGNTVIDLLLEWKYPNLVSETMIFPDKGNSIRYGWRNTAESRKAALERARETIKSEFLRIPSEKLLRQLEYFCTVSLDGGRTKDQALKKGQHKAIGANVDEYCDDMVFAFLGLEHARIALGTPEIPKRPMSKYSEEERSKIWTTQTLPNLESLLGEPAQGKTGTSDEWKDYT